MQPNQLQVFPPQGQVLMATHPSTNATMALVFSILGLVGGFVYGIGIFFSVPGLILANGALRITNQFPQHPDAGTAKAAKIISWVGIALFIAVVGLVVLAGVLYVWASSLAEGNV